MSCKIDLRSEVIDEANSQGVPPEVALAVATQESGLCHWSASGAVKRGTSGEYGIMQLMPATAAALGVDPTDVNDNIHGGVKYLRQLYDRYRDWAVAVQHFLGHERLYAPFKTTTHTRRRRAAINPASPRSDAAPGPGTAYRYAVPLVLTISSSVAGLNAMPYEETPVPAGERCSASEFGAYPPPKIAAAISA